MATIAPSSAADRSGVGTPQIDQGPADITKIEPGVIVLDGFGAGLLLIRSQQPAWPNNPEDRR